MDKNTQLAVQSLIREANDQERNALYHWASELIKIRESSATKKEKLFATAKTIKHYKALFPLLKSVKSSLWDKRTTKTKIGISGMLLVAFLFPGNAGIAAMGSAIGVPLWIVFGAGYSFATTIVSECINSVQTNKKNNIVEAEYEIIEDK